VVSQPSDLNAPPEEEAPGPARIRRLCHDLNNPLAVIMGQLEIISERYKDLGDDLAHRHAEIGKAGEAMREMIREAGGEARRAMGVE
jgi:signal transduction histidine kinase